MAEKTVALWKALFCCLLGSFVTAEMDSNFCKKPDDAGSDVRLTKFPQQFSANVQLNHADGARTIDATIEVDLTNGLSAATVSMDAEVTKFIVNHQDNSVLKLNMSAEGTTCTVDFLENFKAGDLTTKDASQVLRLLNAVVAEEVIQSDYVNTPIKQAKGILVEQWDACTYVKDGDANVHIVYSFSHLKWKPSYQPERRSGGGLYPTFPVRVEIRAKGSFGQSEVQQPEIVMDISNFQPRQPDSSAFRPPVDAYCADYKTDVTVPMLPEYFSYSSEIILHSGTDVAAADVSHKQVSYDYRLELNRIDFQESSSDTVEGSGPTKGVDTTVIQDFKTGIEYRINSATGACEASKIDHNYGAISSSRSAYAVMSNPRKFFSLDVALSYNGEYTERGLAVDVFSGQVQDGDSTRLFQWFFTDKRTSIVEDQSVVRSVPLKVVSRPAGVTGTRERYDINFYNFKEDEPDDNVYDVSSCYNETQQKVYILQYPGHFAKHVVDQRKTFEFKLQNVLREEAGVRPLRLRLTQGIYLEEKVEVEFRLFGLLPVADLPPNKVNSLERAEEKLREALAAKRLGVQLTFKDGETLRSVTVEPKADGLQEMIRLEKPEGRQDDSLKYTPGNMALLGIGMALFGFIVGGIAVDVRRQIQHARHVAKRSGDAEVIIDEGTDSTV